MTQPRVPVQTCSVTAGSGTVTTAAVTGVTVACAAPRLARFAYLVNYFRARSQGLLRGSERTARSPIRLAAYLQPQNWILTPVSVAVSPPAGEFVYVATTSRQPVSWPTPSTAADRCASSRFRYATPGHGGRPSSIAVDPSGRFVYVANANGRDNVLGLWVDDPMTGALNRRRVIAFRGRRDVPNSSRSIPAAGSSTWRMGWSNNVTDL